MALRIESKKKEIDTIFFLEEDGDGKTVSLYARFENDSEKTYICTISPDGMFLYSGVDSAMGFKVDGDGVIMHRTNMKKSP